MEFFVIKLAQFFLYLFSSSSEKKLKSYFFEIFIWSRF